MISNNKRKKDVVMVGYLRIISQFTLALGLFFLIQISVWGDTFQDIIKRGLDAFRTEDYKTAIKYFEQARNINADDAKLNYNLGVTYYKLERYSEAENAFLSIKKEPDMEALAFYNLGLVALKQDDDKQAEEWFRQTLDVDKEGKPGLLAREQLVRLGAEIPVVKKATNDVFAMVRAGIGYDDNVILQSDDQVLSASGKSDTYLELFAYGDKYVSRVDNQSIRLDGNIYTIRYSDLSPYDLTNLVFGGVLEQGNKSKIPDIGLHQGFTYLDGSDFTRTTSLDFQKDHIVSRDQKIRLIYKLDKIDDMDPVYSHLDGWKHQAWIDSTWRQQARQYRLSYRFEYNDRQDSQTPLFTSYSPTRHSLRASVKLPINSKLKSTLEARYRYSRYNDANEQSDGSFIIREDDRYRLIAKLVYGLTKNTDLIGRYTYTKNDSNISGKQYTRSQTLLSISHIW